jgi:prophage DNA circulation protein
MADVFEQLLAFKWRDVEFPVTRMRLSLAHDLVEHKYWGVDGARVEATGLAPLRFHATIPLLNTIVPGKSENWDPRQYPDGLRALVIAFAKKETGIIQHPEFGFIPAKAERLDIDWDANVRGGVMAEASWVETISDDDIRQAIEFSPVNEVQLAALDLDVSGADLKKLIPHLPEYKTTLDDLLRGVTGVFDQATLLSMRFAGKIDSVVYRVQTLEDSVDRAKNALTWPIKQNIERVKAAAYNIRQTLLQLGKDIVFYRVPADTTLAGVAAQLPDTNVGDLIKLNPQLMRTPEVPANTLIRYYGSKLSV